MIPPRLLVSVAVAALAVLALGLSVGQRLGAAGTARPVVRQTFVVTLDPDAPDFVVDGLPAGPWTLSGFDETGWVAATDYGVDYVAQRIAGSHGVWTADSDLVDRVFFRRSFSAGASDDGSLTIDCDNEYRAFLNGVLIGSDDAWGSPEVYDLAGLFRDGENVLALEGLDRGGPGRLACRAVGSFGEIVSDASFKVTDQDPEPDDRLNGSAWKVIPVPGLNRRAQASFAWNDVRALPQSEHPNLRGLWRAETILPVTYARDGEVLVQLRAATRDGGNDLVTAGAYRLTVDMVE